MIFEKVVKILVEATDCEASEIKMESTWEELDLDSLDTVDLLMELEEEFDVSVEMNENLKTVGDVVNEIKNKLEA